jgi:HD-like signal output (HDOD) protein
MDALTLVRDVTTLASLPGACVRVMALADDPHATAQQMAEVIAHDPALAARLLKPVNSAADCRIRSTSLTPQSASAAPKRSDRWRSRAVR